MARPLIKNVVCVLVLVLLAIAKADTPPGIANNPSHARCLIKKYKMCYNLEHVCPKFCPDSCTVECVSCKPICGGDSTAPPPDSEAPPPPEKASPPPDNSPPNHGSSGGEGKSPPSEGDNGNGHGKGSPPESSPPPVESHPSSSPPPYSPPSVPVTPSPSPPATPTPTLSPPPPPSTPTPSTPPATPTPTPSPSIPPIPTPSPPHYSPPPTTPPSSPPPTLATPKPSPPQPTPSSPSPPSSTPPSSPTTSTPPAPVPSTPSSPSSPTPSPSTSTPPTASPTPNTPSMPSSPSSPTPSPPASTPPTYPTPGTPPTPVPSTPSSPSSPTPSPPSTPPTASPTPNTPSTPSSPSSPTPPSPTSTPPTTPTPSTPSPSTPTPSTSPVPPTPYTPPSSPGDSSEGAGARRKRCRSRDYPQCYGIDHVCPSSCPNTCQIDCVTCKPVCSCDLPGAICQDPRFIGGDGITFYFHGKKNKDFCLVTDPNFQINAHFIGKRNENVKRDFTWIQSVGILFGNHQLFFGAQKTATWDDAVDRFALAFDGEPVLLSTTEGSTWQSADLPTTTIKRDSNTNSVVIEVDGLFKISAKVVPITQQESKIHNYGITEEDCFAHLELGFKFFSLSGNVNGVLGQTYRDNYVSRVKMGVAMPVLGGVREFAVSNIFATDCAVSQFQGGKFWPGNDQVSVLGMPSMKCGSGIDGRGVVCKR